MKRWFPNTIFARLFVLLLLALVLSHAVFTSIIFSGIADGVLPMPPPPRSPRGFWFIISLQTITFTVAGWFGAKWLARPIQHLAQAASQLGENLNHPALAETGSVEARQAMRVFNRMQERLRMQIAEKNRFLAAVSHDLRTPLTRMKLRADRLAEASVKERLNADIAEMAAMLDATLQYLRGETSVEAWQMLDVQALLYAMTEDAQENGRNVSISGNVQPLLTQPMALRRCVSNVLENALRYGHLARISLQDVSNMLHIEIQDAGPGIPEDKMELVFEPFVCLEPSRNKSFGGIGLGLSIARDAARQCCGTLSLRNAPQGGLVVQIQLLRHQ